MGEYGKFAKSRCPELLYGLKAGNPGLNFRIELLCSYIHLLTYFKTDAGCRWIVLISGRSNDDK